MTAAVRSGLTRQAWIANAARCHFGTCDQCGRNREENGKRLIVVRVEHGRKFRCFDCTTNPKGRKHDGP